VSNKEKSSFQNALVKTLSLSDTIDLGKPCNLTTLSSTARATVCAVKGCLSGINVHI
jgi:hypothetical protein